MPTCCYIVKTWGKNADGSTNFNDPPKQCGAPVGWNLTRDDDNRKVRKYRALCIEHQRIVDAMPEDEE